MFRRPNGGRPRPTSRSPAMLPAVRRPRSLSAPATRVSSGPKPLVAVRLQHLSHWQPCGFTRLCPGCWPCGRRPSARDRRRTGRPDALIGPADQFSAGPPQVDLAPRAGHRPRHGYVPAVVNAHKFDDGTGRAPVTTWSMPEVTVPLAAQPSRGPPGPRTVNGRYPLQPDVAGACDRSPTPSSGS